MLRWSPTTHLTNTHHTEKGAKLAQGRIRVCIQRINDNVDIYNF